MNGHINGWGVISRHLQLRDKNQSDLARLLHISPAAITQIKNGQFRLNPRQLYAIPGYLEFNQAAFDEFFSEIFNARMQVCHGEVLPGPEKLRCIVKVERRSDTRRIPVAGLELLRNFVPALESLADYMRRATRERYCCCCPGGAVALRVNRPLSEGGGPRLVIVKGDTYPVPGNLPSPPGPTAPWTSGPSLPSGRTGVWPPSASCRGSPPGIRNRCAGSIPSPPGKRPGTECGERKKLT